MNEKLLNRARALAKQPYQVLVFPDKTTDGDSIYVAVISELAGCSAWGYTAKEAMASIETAKVDFIYFLLEDGLDVLNPQLIGPETRIDFSEYQASTAVQESRPRAPRGVLLASGA